jgi:hypothetical protein
MRRYGDALLLFESGAARRREYGQASIQCEVSYLDVDVKQLLDGVPKVDSLGVAASQPRATPKSGTVRIFLASSRELEADRNEFDRYFSRRDKPRLKITRWEDFLDAMSATRSQDEYNQAVRESDIFVSLFATKAGQFTVEEFDAALAQFQKDRAALHLCLFQRSAGCAPRRRSGRSRVVVGILRPAP